MTDGAASPSEAGWLPLFGAWLLATVATLGSLFFSQVMDLAPCFLCWIQRIFMFPLPIVLLAGLLPHDPRAWRFGFPLALLGSGVALWHTLLYEGVLPETAAPCSQGVSCSEPTFELFGLLSIPLLSLLAFVAVAGLLLLSPESVQMNRQTLVVLTALVLLGAFAVAAVLYQGQQAEQVATLAEEQSELFVPPYAVRKGEATAKVTIVEFFDPACETCASLAPAVDQLVEDNPGRVQLVQRYAPFHPGSEVVVAALEAARRQDRYGDTLALMFATQSEWASHHQPRLDVLSAHLEKSGLDMEQLSQDMDDPMVRMIIQQDIADAKTLGVTKTPEFFVNGKPLPSWGLQQLQDLVQSELQAKY